MPCHEKVPLACHSERSEESLTAFQMSVWLEILRSAQNDRASPVSHSGPIIRHAWMYRSTLHPRMPFV